MHNSISREELAQRWGICPRTVDRLRNNGLLPWMDLSNGQGKKPIVRFLLQDIEAYEAETRKSLSPGIGNNG
jgi:hypothetical protein